MDVVKEIESLVKKAEAACKADDALKFSQAACNVANAASVVENFPQSNKQES